MTAGGPLQPQASGYTNTRVFCNGREIHPTDLYWLNNMGIFPAPGDRLWLNADGSYGREGYPLAVGNLRMRYGLQATGCVIL
jgi:hypothetical protein